MRYVPPSERRDVDWTVINASQQENANSAASDQATRVVSYLLSGPLLYGGLGWLADQWLGTRILVAIGVLLGFGLSLYLVWLRYGKEESTQRSSASSRSSTRPRAASVGFTRTTSEEIS